MMAPALKPHENNVSRKITLTTNPYLEQSSQMMFVKGYDPHGSEYNICLDYLPAGVSLNEIQQGQTWWVDKKTSLWTLSLYVSGSGYTPISNTTGYITASGNSQSTATPLPANQINVITGATATTNTGSGKGVQLPVPENGQIIYIDNNSSNWLLVYPNFNGQIDSASINGAIWLAPSAYWIGIAENPYKWASFLGSLQGGSNNTINVVYGNGQTTFSQIAPPYMYGYISSNLALNPYGSGVQGFPTTSCTWTTKGNAVVSGNTTVSPAPTSTSYSGYWAFQINQTGIYAINYQAYLLASSNSCGIKTSLQLVSGTAGNNYSATYSSGWSANSNIYTGVSESINMTMPLNSGCIMLPEFQLSSSTVQAIGSDVYPSVGYTFISLAYLGPSS